MGPPTAHLKHPHHPSQTPRHRRAIEVWAAISGALALLAFGYLIIVTPPNWIWLVIMVAVAFGLADAWARGRLTGFLLNVVLGLAVVGAMILFIEYWQLIIVGALAIVVLYMIRDNLREIRG
jgi:uncharacterized membrane protein YccC